MGRPQERVLQHTIRGSTVLLNNQLTADTLSSGSAQGSVILRYRTPGRGRGSKSLGRQPPTGLLHRGQRGLGLCEGTCANINTRGLLGDRDRLTGRRVATLTRLQGWLDTDCQLHQAADGIFWAFASSSSAPPSTRLASARLISARSATVLRELYLG
jgi:hypothetical protein